MKINIGWFDFKMYAISELVIYEMVMVFLSFIGCLFFEPKLTFFSYFLRRLTFIVITRPFLIGFLRINKIKDERISNALSQGIFVVLIPVLDKYTKFFK
ncbi:MAG: hypothetical protein AD073_000280 [Mycoplasmataceae bacterium]|nr:MAG: hypothetical protein AD073_000280 [Mycoplasmataceae bacterium]